MKTAEELYEQNQKFVHFVLHRKFPQFEFNEDVQQEARIGLWKACTTFDPNKSEFSTYAAKCIVNSVYTWIRAMDHQHPSSVYHVSLNEPICEDGMPLEETIEDDKSLVCEGYVSLKEFLDNLPKLQKDIVQLRQDGLTGKQIAKELKISQSYVCRILKDLHYKYKIMCDELYF